MSHIDIWQHFPIGGSINRITKPSFWSLTKELFIAGYTFLPICCIQSPLSWLSLPFRRLHMHICQSDCPLYIVSVLTNVASTINAASAQSVCVTWPLVLMSINMSSKLYIVMGFHQIAINFGLYLLSYHIISYQWLFILWHDCHICGEVVDL